MRSSAEIWSDNAETEDSCPSSTTRFHRGSKRFELLIEGVFRACTQTAH